MEVWPILLVWKLLTLHQLGRQRYLDFLATVTASSSLVHPFEGSMVNVIHQKWSEMIEATERVSSVYKKIFKSSKAGGSVSIPESPLTLYFS